MCLLYNIGYSLGGTEVNICSNPEHISVGNTLLDLLGPFSHPTPLWRLLRLQLGLETLSQGRATMGEL